MMQQSTGWTSRVKEPFLSHRDKQRFYHARTFIGAIGHWILEAEILASLVNNEFGKDNDKRWRYIRMASVATALLLKGLYTYRVHQQREEAKARQEKCCPA